MTYRTSAEPFRPVLVRRLSVGDAFRWPKVVAGFVLVAGATFMIWQGVTSSVHCHDNACAVVQKRMLRSPAEFAFDARNPPEIVLETASMGKYKTGLKLLLRYRGGGDVEILRDWPETAEAHAARMRAYFANPHGDLVVERHPDNTPQIFTSIIWLLGLAMFFDGVGILGWRRLRADPVAHLITFEQVICGVRVRRRSFPIGGSTKVGSLPSRPGDTGASLQVLTLEDAGAAPRRLPVFDRPGARAVVEELVSAAG